MDGGGASRVSHSLFHMVIAHDPSSFCGTQADEREPETMRAPNQSPKPSAVSMMSSATRPSSLVGVDSVPSS